MHSTIDNVKIGVNNKFFNIESVQALTDGTPVQFRSTAQRLSRSRRSDTDGRRIPTADWRNPVGEEASLIARSAQSTATYSLNTLLPEQGCRDLIQICHELFTDRWRKSVCQRIVSENCTQCSMHIPPNFEVARAYSRTHPGKN